MGTPIKAPGAKLVEILVCDYHLSYDHALELVDRAEQEGLLQEDADLPWIAEELLDTPDPDDVE